MKLLFALTLVISLSLPWLTGCARPPGGATAVEEAPQAVPALEATVEPARPQPSPPEPQAVAAIVELRAEMGSVLDDTALQPAAGDEAESFQQALHELARRPTPTARPPLAAGEAVAAGGAEGSFQPGWTEEAAGELSDMELAGVLRATAAALLRHAAAAAAEGQHVADQRYRGLARLLEAEADALVPLAR